mmetsp:Transcript_61198/g.167785  ORF Transcript_61198/g.167785 Transcript_61198/m.167785 type:complete len:322 (-) Transcript_61198:194-1159(-)
MRFTLSSGAMRSKRERSCMTVSGRWGEWPHLGDGFRHHDPNLMSPLSEEFGLLRDVSADHAEVLRLLDVIELGHELFLDLVEHWDVLRHRELAKGLDRAHVAPKDALDPRILHLDHHPLARTLDAGAMYLPDRRRRQRLGLEVVEEVVDIPAEILFDHALDDFEGDVRAVVEQRLHGILPYRRRRVSYVPRNHLAILHIEPAQLVDLLECLASPLLVEFGEGSVALLWANAALGLGLPVRVLVRNEARDRDLVVAHRPLQIIVAEGVDRHVRGGRAAHGCCPADCAEHCKEVGTGEVVVGSEGLDVDVPPLGVLPTRPDQN